MSRSGASLARAFSSVQGRWMSTCNTDICYIWKMDWRLIRQLNRAICNTGKTTLTLVGTFGPRKTAILLTIWLFRGRSPGFWASLRPFQASQTFSWFVGESRRRVPLWNWDPRFPTFVVSPYPPGHPEPESRKTSVATSITLVVYFFIKPFFFSVSPSSPEPYPRQSWWSHHLGQCFRSSFPESIGHEQRATRTRFRKHF